MVKLKKAGDKGQEKKRYKSEESKRQKQKCEKGRTVER